jgi:CheY-like chemotaxis protein
LQVLDKASPAPATIIDGVNILVVEDNRINQIVVTLLLEKLGCLVDIARNGREACAALELKSYGLVLMDCQMPEMDGFEATRKIRRSEGASRHTPIVALTAGVLKEERDQCFSAGMDAFLSKPVSYQILETTLLYWLTPGSSHPPKHTLA